MKIKTCAFILILSLGITACGTTSPVSSSIEETVSNTELINDETTSSADIDDATLSTGSSEGEEVTPVVDENAPPKELTLIMVGDMLLHDRLEAYAKKENGYDYSSFFLHTKSLIEEADVALVNQEVIIGGEELGISGYPCFNAPYEFGEELVRTGFDVVLHGTNHALDKGKKGLINCAEYWKENHPEILVAGINSVEDEYTNISVYETEDFKIAILNYTYSTNGIGFPSDMPYAVDMLDKDKVINDIRWAEENTDFTIVCPHWGTEYSLSVSSYQDKWTSIFLENGVDLVLGTHPHVIEPIKWLENEETGNKMLVYYSLGNYINWTGSTGAGCADRMVGGMASVTLTKEENGTVFISEDTIIPLICHLSTEDGALSVYPYSEYTTELAEENLARKIDSSFSYEYCTNLINNVWGDYYQSKEIE